MYFYLHLPVTRVDWSGHWVDPTDLCFGLLTLHSICIELMIRSGTIGKFSAGQPFSKLPNFHFEGREGRSQAGPNSYSALTQGRSDLRLETQKMKTFKKLFLSKEALDQKSEKKGPEE